jgi:hypothetical protein
VTQRKFDNLAHLISAHMKDKKDQKAEAKKKKDQEKKLSNAQQ